MLTSAGAMTGAYGLADLATVEDIDILFGINEDHVIFQRGFEALDDETRDSGNPSGGTHLRSGLILGVVKATNLYKHWDPTATDGTEIPQFILLGPVNIAPYGVAADGQRAMRILAAGHLLIDQVIIPGQAARGVSGNAYEYMLIEALRERFTIGATRPYRLRKGVRNVIADVTLTIADNNLHFENTGATGSVTVTMPTAVRNASISFFKSTNQTFTVAGVLTDSAGSAQTSIAITLGTGFRFVGRNVGGTVRWVATSLSN